MRVSLDTFAHLSLNFLFDLLGVDVPNGHIVRISGDQLRIKDHSFDWLFSFNIHNHILPQLKDCNSTIVTHCHFFLLSSYIKNFALSEGVSLHQIYPIILL